MPTALLLSARDAAAAHNVAFIAGIGKLDGWDVHIAAQQPAAGILEQAGFRPIRVAQGPVTDRDGAESSGLFAAARRILASTRPDLLICGLSSPGSGGIDEALLSVREVPALLIQDYWGEQNTFFGSGPDRFLALDEDAAAINTARHGLPSTVVGSPRHAAWADINQVATRARARERLEISSTTPVAGWFGQALHGIDGYADTIEVWADAIAAAPGLRAVYKPHPREDAADRARTRDILRAADLDAQMILDWPVEEAILACDLVCSIMSNCLYDTAYLNFFSDRAGPVPLATLVSPQMRRFFDAVTPIESLPYLRSGLARVATTDKEVRDLLRQAARPGFGDETWHAAKAHLSDPRQSLDKIVATVRMLL